MVGTQKSLDISIVIKISVFEISKFTDQIVKFNQLKATSVPVVKSTRSSSRKSSVSSNAPQKPLPTGQALGLKQLNKDRKKDFKKMKKQRKRSGK